MSTAPELSPAEAARVAAFDAAQVPPECDPERVETVARALYLDSYGPASPWTWDEIGVVSRAVFRRLAAAAIAALPPSPAEEAVKRVDPLAFLGSVQGSGDLYGRGWNAALRFLADEMGRAALASPAPAPQGEPCGVDPCDCDHPSHDERAKTAAACQRFNQKLIDGAR